MSLIGSDVTVAFRGSCVLQLSIAVGSVRVMRYLLGLDVVLLHQSTVQELSQTEDHHSLLGGLFENRHRNCHSDNSNMVQ